MSIDTASRNFQEACRRLKSQLQNDEEFRSSAQRTAETDFEGYFKDIFTRNGRIRNQDNGRLRQAIEAITNGIDSARQAAQGEQRRIERAREWKREHDDWSARRESGLITGSLHDFFYSEPQIDTNDLDPGDPPTITFPDTVVNKPELPVVGTAYEGRQTTSASPSNLDSFVNRTNELNSSMPGKIASFEEAYNSFEQSWVFKSGANVISGMGNFIESIRSFNAANTNDSGWIETISTAFKAAGANGSVVSLSNQALSLALQSSGRADSVNRDSLQIPTVQLAGIVPTTGYADDPVNTATGNFIESETDLAFGGGNAGLSISRMYNSLTAAAQLSTRPDATFIGVFGVGWSSSIDQRCDYREQTLVWVREDDREIIFDLVDLDTYDPVSGSRIPIRATEDNYWLEADGSGWLIRDNAGAHWNFTEAGQWTQSRLHSGATLTVERDDNGAVTALAHSRGRRVEFEYDTNRIVVVRASDGRRIEYFYNSEGHLCEVKHEPNSRKYTHNDAGLIREVISAAGVVEVTNNYDDSGRVTSQISQHGRTSRYVYLPGRVTEVSDTDGTRSNTWISDAKGRNVAIIDSDGYRHSKTYDRRGNLVLENDRSNQVTVHSYDDRGHRTRTVLPTKAELKFEWDELDRIIQVTSANGSTINYEYEGLNRNPYRIIDAYGGTSELEWNDGLLMRVTDPEGVTLSFTYDRFGDLLSCANAQGDVTRVVRDPSGNILELITPLGHVTRFTYDGRGILTSKETPDGAKWYFETNHGGQLTAVIDPVGARTSYSYGPDGELFQITDALGRVTTREVDDIGNLSTVTLPDGDQWTLDHDGLSRLKSATDPSGEIWRYEYSETGTLIKTVDPTGVVHTINGGLVDGLVTAINGSGEVTGTIEFDTLGRPVKGVSPGGEAEIITYDACGRPVEFVNADGGLTLLRRDRAGRITSITSPEGRTQTMAYDDCGRLSTVSSPDGASTIIGYNADAQITSITNPAGEISRYAYDPCGRLIEALVAGGGLHRRRYDLLGRVVYSEDPVTGIRSFAYDAVGQLIKSTNGLGGHTLYRYDARGRIVEIIDPRGFSTKYTYNSLDNITSIEDPLGQIKVATYDAAGRQITRTDGNGDTTSFTFNAAGKRRSILINGKVVIEADSKDREVHITDWTVTAGGKPTTHVLRHNRRGNLIQKVTTSPTGKVVISDWGYDRDGLRTSFAVDGITSVYEYDNSGRLVKFTHSRYGEVNFVYDSAGRLVRSSNQSTVDSWSYDNGFVASHLHESGSERVATTVSRDAFGRPLVITHDGESISYQYNPAGQLIGLQSTTGERRGWHFETSGHMSSSWHENAAGEKRVDRYFYNQASQLISQVQSSANEMIKTHHEYDHAGRRTASHSSLGSRRKFTWDSRGWLRRYFELRDGESVIDLEVTVDGLGQVTSINDLDLVWDFGATLPKLERVGNTPITQIPGGALLAGDIRHDWAWRQVSGGSTLDPYEITAYQLPGMPAGLEITPSGLSFGGHVWMGVHIFDTASSSFLSTDPVPAPVASVWASNPYNYLANNPLTLSDPLGLTPITDLEVINDFNANASQSGFVAAKQWVGDNWEYIAAGGAIIFGIALMATGVGGPAGLAVMAASGGLISGGISATVQKYTTGTVDWCQVGKEALVGAASGFVGGAGSYALKGLGISSRAVAVGSGIVEGAASGGIGYMLEPGPHTLQGFLFATGLDAATGGTAARVMDVRWLRNVTERPDADVLAMGRDMKNRVQPFADYFEYGYYKGTPEPVHKAWDAVNQHLPGYSPNWGQSTGLAAVSQNLKTKVDLNFNESWITRQMDADKILMDIGETPGMRPSNFYNMELDTVHDYGGTGYSNYHVVEGVGETFIVP